MATLVLTAVGGIVGGPIGAAVGGAIGQGIDRGILFKPPLRQGPRLTELAVQTSSYGTPIPKLFGTMRVAGTVIWATDLIETRARDDGGKGAADSVRYSYSASFAVLLSARPIRGIRRIWADGKLLRGAAGDFKSMTRFRWYPGDETQAPDPMIAVAQGIGRAPAHRGCAYAVFEDMALADYANRIPSLTFEVEADAGSVDAGAIAVDLGEGQVASEGALLPLAGFSAHGGSLRAVFETIAEASGGWFAPEGDRLVLRGGEDGPAHAIDDVGMVAGSGSPARRVRAIAPSDTAPRAVTVRHYDPMRDYQAGVQRAGRPGAGHRVETIDLPAVLEAAGAKAIAAAMLGRRDRDRERREVMAGHAALTIRPGDRVTIGGAPQRWRVAGWALERGVVTLTLARIGAAVTAGAASPGSFVPPSDVAHGPTTLHAFEIAPLDGSAAGVPRIAIAAAGVSPGWRRAGLILSGDSGASWRAIGSTRGTATIGTVTMPPGVASALIEDRGHAIEVELAHAGMTLASADAGRMDAGANLALVGDELLQFAGAEPIGPRRWRLTRLWRARRGSEAAIPGHQAGERFVLIEDVSMLSVDVPIASLGTPVTVQASGVADDDPVVATVAIDGRSLLPLAPVHLRWEREAGGDVAVRWIRRSRTGFGWVDGVDAPIGEEREAYRLNVRPGSPGVAPFEVETSAALAVLPGAALTGGAAIEVRQVGAHGLSSAATADIDA